MKKKKTRSLTLSPWGGLEASLAALGVPLSLASTMLKGGDINSLLASIAEVKAQAMAEAGEERRAQIGSCYDHFYSDVAGSKNSDSPFYGAYRGAMDYNATMKSIFSSTPDNSQPKTPVGAQGNLVDMAKTAAGVSKDGASTDTPHRSDVERAKAAAGVHGADANGLPIEKATAEGKGPTIEKVNAMGTKGPTIEKANAMNFGAKPMGPTQ